MPNKVANILPFKMLCSNGSKSIIIMLFSELGYLIRLSMPIILTQLARTSMSVVDVIMTGHYSVNDLAAVSLGASIWFPVFVFGYGIVMMICVDIGKLRQESGIEEIRKTINYYLNIVLILLPLMIVVLYGFMFSLQFFAIDSHIINITQGYIYAMIVGLPGLMLFNVFRSLLQGFEDTKMAMSISIAAFFINIPLNYALIFGFGFIPEMGGIGSGITTCILNTLSAIGLISYFYIYPAYKKYRPKILLKFNAKTKQLLTVGLPSGLAFFIEVVFINVIAITIAPLGAHVIATNNIMLNIVTIIATINTGIALATTIRIGVVSAQKERQVIEKVSFLSLGSMTVISLLLIAGIMIFNVEIFSLYTDDKEVIDMLSDQYLLLCFFLFFSAIQAVLCGILRGLQQTKIVFYAPLLGYWLLGMPLCLSLAMSDVFFGKMGLTGFWLGLVLTLGFNVILLVSLCRSKLILLNKPLISS